MFVTLPSLLMIAVLFEDSSTSAEGPDAVLCGEQLPISLRP